MRLIDADALIADCQLAQKQADRHGREYANAFYSGGGEVSTEWWCVEDMIENAPTIEPKTETKTPRWVAEDRFVKGHYFEYPHCPKCNGELTTGQCYCSICGQHIAWDEEEGKTE